MHLKANDLDSPDSSYHPTELYAIHGKAISSYLRLHKLSLGDREDLLVEIFVAALEHDNLSSMSSQEQLAWLRRVAHNKMLNIYRSARRHPQISLDSIAEVVIEEQEPEHLALQHERHGQLRAHVQQLPLLQQRILQLRYGDGLRYADIAILLDKREDTIRKIASRTILVLREIYRQTEGEDIC